MYTHITFIACNKCLAETKAPYAHIIFFFRTLHKIVNIRNSMRP